MAAQKRLRSDQHQDLADPENIGGRADTSSKRPRASTGLEGQDEPVQYSSPPQVDVVPDIVIPPRRYATRMSTQVARPAKAAGLVPRTKAEITSEAAAKKAQKNAKAQRVTEKKARIAEGVAKLGRLQQERIASDAAEERDLRTARPVQDDGPGVQEPSNRASHPPNAKQLPRGLYSSSSSSEDDLGDALQPIRLKSTRRTPPSADDEGSTLDYSPESEELPDDANIDELQDDADAEEFDNNVEVDGSEYDHTAELGNNDFAAEFEDDPEADELEDDPEADEDGFEEGDEDGDGDDAEPDAVADGKLSKAQKRIKKRIELRQMISRSAPAISRPKATTSAKSAHSMEAPHAATKKKPKNAPEVIFRSDWKANLVERQRPKPAPTGVPAGRSVASKSAAAPSRPSATPARASNSASASSCPSQTPSRRPPQTPSQSSHIPGGTSGWKAALQPPHSVGRLCNAGEGSASEGDDPAQTNALRFGGFTDADVSSTPEYALATGGLRRKSKLIVQAVEESEDDNNGLGARAPVRKRPRRAASEVPEEESRSSRHLPGFIKPFLEPSIIPTVINYYGAKENPWDLQELGRDELLDLCQTLVDEVLPRKGHIVKKSELIYKLTQQAIYAWRSNFAQVAICAVQEAIKTKFGPKRQIHEVKRWVAAAITSGGEAMWARPKTGAARAEGKLQSKYVLKTFASHLTSTTGSLHDYGYPGGALSLAAAAVKHVFPMFETGVFVAAGAFSGTNIENDTSDWYTKTVSIFVRRPDHFNVLLRQAAKLATATKVRKVNPREREVSVEFSRSSPPLEDHELDMV